MPKGVKGSTPTFTRHSELVSAIVQYLGYKGFTVFKHYNGATFDPGKRIYRKPKGAGYLPGVPDVIGFYDDACPRCGYGPIATFSAMEAKIKNDKLSLDQKCFIERVQRMGGMSCEVRNLGDLDAMLKSHKDRKL